MTEISQSEYYNWLKHSEIVCPESIRFSATCGIHEFGTIIRNQGTLYDLLWGNDVENNESVYWWGIKTLYKDFGQDGDGI